MIREIPERDAANFMLAGRAQFALKSKHTQLRFVYEVCGVDGESTFYVNALRGVDCYARIGTIHNKRGGLEFRRNVSWPSAVAFERAFPYIIAKTHEKHMTMTHLGTCGRCRRPLTAETSVIAGIGPICAEKMGYKV